MLNCKKSSVNWQNHLILSPFYLTYRKNKSLKNPFSLRRDEKSVVINLYLLVLVNIYSVSSFNEPVEMTPVFSIDGTTKNWGTIITNYGVKWGNASEGIGITGVGGGVGLLFICLEKRRKETVDNHLGQDRKVYKDCMYLTYINSIKM